MPPGYTPTTVLFALLAALGFVGGFLSGLLGIGGGIVLVPLLFSPHDLRAHPAKRGRHAAIA